MSEKELRDLVAFASQQGEKIFTAIGELRPLWHAITATGEHLIDCQPHHDKDMAVALMRAYFDIRDVVRYVFLDEAWTLERLIRSDEMAMIRRDGLSKHPERIEIVMIQAEDRDCGQLTAQRRIIRPAKGKAYLGPLQLLDELPHLPAGAKVQSEGRMVGMLPVRGSRH